MNELLTKPWPWYVSGPLIGLMVPVLLYLCNKPFGISSSLRHICAACVPTKAKFFKYDWKAESWLLVFALGIAIGGFLAGYVFKNPDPVRIAESTVISLESWGIKDFSNLAPPDIFSLQSLLTAKGFILMVVGGFLVGFGTRYANGCTSGHAIMGISSLKWPSLVATMCFFAGGLIMTWFGLPFIMSL